MKKTILLSALVAALSNPSGLALADTVPLTQNRDIHINVSNDAGAMYGDPNLNDTYWINAPGGGLNQLHITTNPTTAGLNGQVTTQNISTSSASGTFWVSTTGGRGFNDAIVLMASVQGPVSDNFSLTIKSSGYLSGNSPYTSGALVETFTKSDFLYGPNTAKPGPGTLGVWSLPFYSGQNINDPATASYLMFIDLYVGNNSNRALIDSGNAKVEFTVEGLYQTTLALNAYAYAFQANIADGSINWTNRLSTNLADAGQSGYSINSTAIDPVPLPAAVWLFGSALVGLWFAGRRRSARALG
jgi:hypothetical protein